MVKWNGKADIAYEVVGQSLPAKGILEVSDFLIVELNGNSMWPWHHSYLSVSQNIVKYKGDSKEADQHINKFP